MRLRLGGWLAAFTACVVWTGVAGVGGAEPGAQAESGERLTANPFGHIDGDRYTNAHFGVAFDTPEDWHRGNDELLAQAIDLGKAAVSEDVERLVDATRQNMALVFFASEHEVGAPVAFNPNLSFVVERLAHAPGIKTTRDYVAAMQRSLAGAEGLRQHEGVEARELAGREWLSVRQTVWAMGAAFEQRLFVRFERGYGMLVTASALAEEGLPEVEAKLAEGLEGL